MFTEILRIIPRLDEGRAKAAEMTLTRRFGRIAGRFGVGLKNAIKGSVIGLSLAFLTRLLNPLQDMHDRIKKLLGETDDVRETAAKLGTTPGELLFHQARAEALGVKPETFLNLVESFRKAVEQRRQDVDEKTRTRLGAGDPLLFQENSLAGFQRALNLIEAFQGVDPAKARAFQRELFGEALTGSQLKLLEPIGNVPLLGNPSRSIERAQEASDVLGRRADAYRMITAVQDFEDRLRTSRALTGAVTAGVLQTQQKELDKQFSELQRFDTLQKAAEVLDGVLAALNSVRDSLFKVLAWLNENGQWFRDFMTWVKPFVSGLRGRK